MHVVALCTSALFQHNSWAAVAGSAVDAANKLKAARAPRAKAFNMDVDAVQQKVMAAAAAGTLAKLNIPELKCYLKDAKLPVKGKKEDLIAKVQQHLASSSAAGPALKAAAVA